VPGAARVAFAASILAVIIGAATVGTAASAVMALPVHAANGNGPTVKSVLPDQGTSQGGSRVKITGSGFSHVTAVRFGSVPASFVVHSSEQIDATSPAADPGTVDITVTARSVSQRSKAATFTYVAAFVPRISVVTPDTGAADGGTMVTIFGGGLSQARLVRFGNTSTAKFLVKSDREIVVASPKGVVGKTVHVSVIAARGSSTWSGADRFTFVAASAAAATNRAPPALIGKVAGPVLKTTGAAASGAPPTVNGIDPNSGPPPGGSYLNIYGSGFTQATGVTFGANRCVRFSAFSDNQMVAQIPPGTLGQTVDVIVISPSGSSGLSLADQFSYVNPPAPVVFGITPASGSSAGNTPVLIHGKGLSAPTAIKFGNALAQGGYPLDDATLYVTSPPQGTNPSTVDITVTNLSGATSSTSAADRFTYHPPSAPVVNAIDANHGSSTGHTAVTIYGSGFTGATAVKFAGTSATNLGMDNDGQLFVYSPPQGTNLATVDVTVVTPVATSPTTNADKFTYDAAGPPVVSGIAPSSGSPSGGVQVDIFGSGLGAATSVKFGGVAGTQLSVLDDGFIMATSPPRGANPATVDITVVAPTGTSTTSPADAFTYNAPLQPAVYGVSPSQGPINGGQTVDIEGKGFTGATAVKFGSVSAISFYVWNDGASIFATSPAHALGTVEVTVTNSIGTSAAGTPADQFTYVAASAPTVNAVSPNRGSSSGGIMVTIFGAGFAGNGGSPPPNPTVTFGTTPASGTLLSDSEIFVTAPSGTTNTTVHVTVTTTVGSSASTAADQFTYFTAPTPAIDAVSPNSGPASGSTTVFISGSGFTGATQVQFGTNATYPYVVSDNVIRATSPPGTASTSVDVVVTTPGGSATASAAFSYTATQSPTPAVTGIGPSSGPASGFTTVYISGSGFTGATAVAFGTTTPSSFTVLNDNLIQDNGPNPPSDQTVNTTVDVRVTTAGGTSAITTADQYTYTAVPAPTVTAVSPGIGPATGGTTVYITGTALHSATTVTFGATTATFFSSSDTLIQATSPAQGTNAATVDIKVTTASGTSATGTADQFTWGSPPPPSGPVVSGLSVNHGPAAGQTFLTIYGSGFTGATAVKFGASPAQSFYAYSDSTMSATSPSGAVGTVDVTVTVGSNTSGTSVADNYTYAAPGPPAVYAVAPNRGTNLGGASVSLYGANFSAATQVAFGTSPSSFYVGYQGSSITTTSPPQGSNPGTVDVTVTTPVATSAAVPADRFTYRPPGLPVVNAVSPNRGSTAGGSSVQIFGSELTGLSGVHFGTLTVQSFGASDSQLYVGTPPGAAGQVDVTVTTPGGTSSTSAADHFTFVIPPVPLVTGVSPGSGPSSGNPGTFLRQATVFISGQGLSGAYSVNFGGSCTLSISAISDNVVSVFTVPPGAPNTTVDLTVSTPGGTSAINAADKYTYTPTSAPTVTAVNPSSGTANGGTTVWITGTRLASVTSVKFGTVSAPLNYFFGASDNLLQVVSPPAPATGAVDITVSGAGGTSVTSAADQFTYVAGSVPMVTWVSPGSGSSDGGTTVFLTGSGFLGATSVTFGGIPPPPTCFFSGSGRRFGSYGGPCWFVFSDTLIEVVGSPGGTVNTTVDVRVSNAAGTSAISTADHFMYTATPAPLVSAVSPNSGPPATTVYVSGRNFMRSMAVKFGSTTVAPSKTEFLSDDMVRVTSVPAQGANPALVDVTVGASAISSSDQFTYTAAPLPVVQVVSPSSGQAGSDVFITGTGLLSTTAVQVGGVNVVSFIVFGDTLVRAAVPSGVGTVHVVVTTLGGPSATSSADQFTYTAPAAPVVRVVSPSAGPAGTTVYITGTALTGTTAVNFGIATATFVKISDTLVRATAPSGTGTVHVTVTTAGGVSATSSADQFTYGAGPIVLTVAPNNGPTAGGTAVTVTGSGFTGATAVHFGANAGTNLVVTSDTQLTVKSPAGFGTVDVTVTTPVATSPSAAADQFTYGDTFTATSTKQYLLANSDGTTWKDLDTSGLSLTLQPQVDSQAIISGNADLWTTQPGYNQDIGLYVAEANPAQYPGNIVAWKESGGYAGTLSPNAAFVQTVFPMTAGTTYHVKLQWKTNKNTGSSGEIIVAGAGDWPAHTGIFSPSMLTARLIPTVAVGPGGVQTTVSAQQYLLTNSDGNTWQDIDAAQLGLTVTPQSNSLAIVSGNADLWTTMPGFNQDLGIYLQEASINQYPGDIVAWKESGGFAGTFSPNAAYVQTVIPLTGGTTYHFKLRWKTNKNTNNNGEIIVAGAGPWPSSSTSFSPTRLTVQLVAAGTNPATAASTTQYLLTNSDGNTWQDIDPTNLSLAVTPSSSCLAVISGNTDLWTTQAGYNQDIGIYIQEASAVQYPANIVAWKESGGFAGTFSPNAAFVQTVIPLNGGITYHVKLRWKTNKNTNNNGETIVAGAGDWPANSGLFSPTRLTVQLVSCS